MNKWKIGYIEPFWYDEQYKDLNYRKEPFNNPKDLKKWREQGYTHPVELFTGMMCKHGETQPRWNNKIIEWLEKDFNWMKSHKIDDILINNISNDISLISIFIFLSYRNNYD